MSKLVSADLEILEEVLKLVPELRACTLAVRRARTLKIAYPITSYKAFARVVTDDVLAGLRVPVSMMEHYIIAQDFPIADEQDLIRAMFVSLSRFNEDALWAARAPENAQFLLAEHGKIAQPEAR